MEPTGKFRHFDRRLAALARRQTVFTVEELRALGLGDRAISARVEAKRLFRPFRGVYSLAPKLPPLERILAATLSTNAAASHFAGLHAYGLTTSFTGAVDVTSRRQVRRQPGLRPHRATRLRTTTRHGIELVEPVLLLTQLSRSKLTDDDYRRVVNEALVQELVTESELERAARGRLRVLLELGVGRARSYFEDAFPPWARRHDLPGYFLNAKVHGVEVDVHFPDHHLVLELDGEKYHRTTIRKSMDARKQRRLEALGIRVLRAEQLDDELLSRLAWATATRRRAA